MVNNLAGLLFGVNYAYGSMIRYGYSKLCKAYPGDVLIFTIKSLILHFPF